MARKREVATFAAADPAAGAAAGSRLSSCSIHGTAAAAQQAFHLLTRGPSPWSKSASLHGPRQQQQQQQQQLQQLQQLQPHQQQRQQQQQPPASLFSAPTSGLVQSPGSSYEPTRSCPGGPPAPLSVPYAMEYESWTGAAAHLQRQQQQRLPSPPSAVNTPQNSPSCDVWGPKSVSPAYSPAMGSDYSIWQQPGASPSPQDQQLLLQRQQSGECGGTDSSPPRRSVLSSDSMNMSFDAVLEQVCRLLHANSGGSVSSASTPRKASLADYPLEGLLPATQIAVNGRVWRGEEGPFAAAAQAPAEAGVDGTQQQQLHQQQMQQQQQQQQQQRASGRSRTQGRTKYGRPHNQSDPVTRSSPTAGVSENSWPVVQGALHQAKQLLQGPLQQQQLVDAAGNAQIHECLSRLHEAVLVLQRENQLLVSRIQQQQQQQQQMRLQQPFQLLHAPKGGAASRAQSLSPFGTASEFSGCAEGSGGSSSSAANLSFSRALSGGVLPRPEVSADEIRSAPNPSTPLLRGGDISVERFLSTFPFAPCTREYSHSVLKLCADHNLVVKLLGFQGRRVELLERHHRCRIQTSAQSASFPGFPNGRCVLFVGALPSLLRASADLFAVADTSRPGLRLNVEGYRMCLVVPGEYVGRLLRSNCAGLHALQEGGGRTVHIALGNLCVLMGGGYSERVLLIDGALEGVARVLEMAAMQLQDFFRRHPGPPGVATGAGPPPLIQRYEFLDYPKRIDVQLS
ncbi:centrosomal and chromosomal factor [Cyclospora cayetanensis]|uniref:Centrosomal and chromosomal factor n=1 Tax=Cyclospora cayetanensis TaxID=88456 RepID=A0A6P6RTS8_9EIME|nr:centrosomal and chromosomal factor [Cyclospora cayetanensis]